MRVFVLAGLSLAASSHHAGAQNLFEMLFGGGQKPQQQKRQPPPPSDNPIANFFADPFGVNKPEAPQRQAATGGGGGGGGGPGFCVRTCDGKYFPLIRSAASPAQMCQAFCPAATTKVYFGSVIDDSVASTGERYADSANAFGFRKALKADCTCNGRSPAGLAQVDLTLDSSLRAGDVVATANGLVAYSGARGGGSMDFTPVASYPGLTADVRNRLGEMKVSPTSPEQAVVAPAEAATVPVAPPALRSTAQPKARRADAVAAPR